MKKRITPHIIQLFLLWVFIFTACSKDKKDGGPSIIGRWIYEKNEKRSTANDDVTMQQNTIPPNSYFEFRSDGTMSGETDIPFQAKWQLNGNRLSIIDLTYTGEGTDVYVIQELSENKLQLYKKEIDGLLTVETTIYGRR